MSKRLNPEEKEAIIAEYTLAYEAANGKTCEVTHYGSGWYIIDGRSWSKYRMATLVEMTARLRERVNAAN